MGTSGINTLLIIIETIVLNSSNPFNNELFLNFESPIPNINAKTNADIIFSIGGISIVKYGSIFKPDSDTKLAFFINFGKTADPRKNAAVPAIIVEIYAKAVVPKRTLPEFLPSVAIPGTINAIIISGITNERKLPKRELNVDNIRTGNVILVDLHISPRPIPSTSAKKIRFINENCFILKFLLKMYFSKGHVYML